MFDEVGMPTQMNHYFLHMGCVESLVASFYPKKKQHSQQNLTDGWINL